MSAWRSDNGKAPQEVPDTVTINGVWYRHECNVPFSGLKRKFVCPCGRTWHRESKRTLDLSQGPHEDGES